MVTKAVPTPQDIHIHLHGLGKMAEVVKRPQERGSDYSDGNDGPELPHDNPGGCNQLHWSNSEWSDWTDWEGEGDWCGSGVINMYRRRRCLPAEKGTNKNKKCEGQGSKNFQEQ